MRSLGIDYGGTGIKGALVDCVTGQLISERLRFRTPFKSKPVEVANVVMQMIDKLNWNGRIGIGFPGVIREDIAMNAANISKDWIGLNIVDKFTEWTGNPTVVINDADAAGLAEMTFGVGQLFKNEIVLMLTVGTGIGSCIFTKGHMLPNTEFGHLQIRGKEAEKRSSDYVRRKKNLSWRKWAQRFQEFLTEMEKLINPDVIILGGGVSKYHDDYFDLLETRAKLIPAKYLNNAGIVGAALYANSK